MEGARRFLKSIEKKNPARLNPTHLNYKLYNKVIEKYFHKGYDLATTE